MQGLAPRRNGVIAAVEGRSPPALVADRWRPRVDKPLAGRHRRCAPPPRSPLIRHCDELRGDTDSLTKAAVVIQARLVGLLPAAAIEPLLGFGCLLELGSDIAGHPLSVAGPRGSQVQGRELADRCAGFAIASSTKSFRPLDPQKMGVTRLRRSHRVRRRTAAA
jgi:hypothetical protein